MATIDPSRRPKTPQDKRQELLDREQEIRSKPQITAEDSEELARIRREHDRLSETDQERADREADEEASGKTGEEIDHAERAEDAGLTPAELDARDQARRDEASGKTGEELDERDRNARDEASGKTGEQLDADEGRIPTRDSDGGSGGGSDGNGSGSGGSGSGAGDGDGDGDGDGGGGDGDGGGGGEEMSDGGDDNPHGGHDLPESGGFGHLAGANLGHGLSGLDLERLRAGDGDIDPNPEADNEDDNPTPKHQPVTGTSSDAVRHSPVPRTVQPPTPHSDPRVTDPQERNG